MADDDWPAEPETRRLRHLQTAMTEAELAIGRRMGMRTTDLSAMGHLTFAPGPLGPSDLSARLGMTPPAVTELVDRLERAGHVDRHRDETDRRRVNLVPTASALTEVRAELAPLMTAVDRVARTYAAPDRAVVNRFLDDVIAAYADFATEGPR